MNEAPTKNKSGRKSLDKLAKDPRVKEIWDEGEDGIWVSLMPGYHVHPEGTTCLHEWSAKAILDSVYMIRKTSEEA